VAIYGLIALALVLWGCSLRMPMQDPWRVLIWGFPAWALVLAATAYESRYPVTLWRPLTVIADASYSIYIFHIFIALFLEIAVKRLPAHLFPNAVVVMLLCFAACLVIGIAGHYLIEKPVTAYLNGLQKRKPRAAVPQAVVPVETPEFMGAEASGLA
jgi:exopolysaccharide production protein ExoZ